MDSIKEQMSSENKNKYRLKSLKSTNNEPNVCPICWTEISSRALTDIVCMNFAQNV